MVKNCYLKAYDNLLIHIEESSPILDYEEIPAEIDSSPELRDNSAPIILRLQGATERDLKIFLENPKVFPTQVHPKKLELQFLVPADFYQEGNFEKIIGYLFSTCGKRNNLKMIFEKLLGNNDLIDEFSDPTLEQTLTLKKEKDSYWLCLKYDGESSEFRNDLIHQGWILAEALDSILEGKRPF